MIVYKSLGKCQIPTFQRFSKLCCTVTGLTLWKPKDHQQGPLRPIKTMQTWITLYGIFAGAQRMKVSGSKAFG